MQTRRGLITGLISLVAAPAIIRVNHLMPISAVEDIDVATNPIWIKTKYVEYDWQGYRVVEEYGKLVTDQNRINEIMELLTLKNRVRLT